MGMKVKPFVDWLNDFMVNDLRSTWKIRQIKMVQFLVHQLYERTPELTGFARNNWRVSAGFIPSGVIGERYSNTKNDHSATLQTDDEIADELDKVKGARSTGVVFVYNNVEYIQALEYGWSRQAPTGILEIAVNNTRNHFISKGWLV